ncbi:MAG: zinc ribbon domain-containing protein [Chloroflexi bacterium]|nr:zinc ribbon domain-containing protein [Chloroflexota bacterium]
MPVYEYECENCGARFERHQSFKDEPVRYCPECSGTVHKVFHPAGIIFKGSGWYITDSRKSTSGTVTGETKPPETKEAKATETKEDKKPAAEAKTGGDTGPKNGSGVKTETK